MKFVAIQKAVNVIKSRSWTSPIDCRYQDETSQFKIDCDRIAAHKLGRTYTPKPWEALPYLAKEDIGKIHIRGFLHDLVAQNRDGTFTHPTKLSTEEVIRRLNRAWREHTQKSPDLQVTHHRLVFSLSKEFHDTLVAAVRNPDMALRGVIERSMRALQEKFHPGDSLGYSYGLHHDTDNLHAHIFIHPRTSKGAFVGMSGKPEFHKGHASRHKDQLGFLRESVRRRVSEVLKEVSDPKERAPLSHSIFSDRIFIVPRKSHIVRAKNDFRPRTPADFQLEPKRAAVATFDKKIAAKRLELHAAISGNPHPSTNLFKKPKWMRRLEQAQTAKFFRELRELQAQRHRLWEQYHEARRRLVPGSQATKTVPKRKKSEAHAPTLKPSFKPTVTVRPKSKKFGQHL